MRWIEKWMPPFFHGLHELYHRAKFGEDRTMRAGCRCENLVFFVGHALSPEHRSFEGCIVQTSIAFPFIDRFRRGFQRFYRQDCRVAADCRYCFYSQAKNQVFLPAGATRCTDSGQTLQDRRAPGFAWLCKISRQSVQPGGNAAPKISKISTFW